MDQSIYTDLVKKINSCNINDESRARLLGKYYELYDTPIRHAMSVGLYADGPQDESTHQKLRNFYGIIPKFNEAYELDTKKTIQYKWFTNRVLRYVDGAVAITHPQYFIYEFKNFLNFLTIKSVSDIIETYKRSCIFLKGYVNYIKNTQTNISINEVARFLINDVIYEVFAACTALYKIWKTEEEFVVYDDLFLLLEGLGKCMSQKTDPFEASKSFARNLCNFYKNYGIPIDFIYGNKTGMDPYFWLYLNSGNDILTKVRGFTFILATYVSGDMDEADTIIHSYTESVSLENSNVTGEAHRNIAVFGNNSLVNELSSNGLNSFKMDLERFDQEFIKNYINKPETVKVDFLIDEQYKMYLQAELGCKIAIVNLTKENEMIMFTILQYENDNFVLFTVSDEPNTLYGLSLIEDSITRERKLITINKDDDLSFELSVNIDNE